MYLDHFKLADFPFLQSGKDELFFVTPIARKQTEHIHHWLDCGHDFLLLSGAEGSGRVALVQHALKKSQVKTHIVTIGGLSLSDSEFLHYIALELGITPPALDLMTLRHCVKTYLKERADNTSRIALVILQAEKRSEAQLNLLRDLATDADFYLPLCAVILVGDTEYAKHSARQIKSQPGGQLHCQIQVRPYNLAQTRNYLNYRWALVQTRNSESDRSWFDDNVVSEIHHQSGGNVGAINRLTDYALLAASAERKPSLASHHVIDAAKLLGWNKAKKRAVPSSRPTIKVSRHSPPAAAIPSQQGEVHQLLQDVTTIGRADDCSIQLTHEKISPCQALIVKTPDGLFVRNEGGDVPVTLNADPIGSAALHIGDILQIGDFRLSMTAGSDGTLALVAQQEQTV